MTNHKNKSGLIVPGQDPAAQQAQQEAAARKAAEGHVELLPSEINNVKMVSAYIQEKYGFKWWTESSDREFTNEVMDRFAALGLIANVVFNKVDVDGDPNSTQLYFMPSISIVGRTDANHQMDHEQYAREVQAGELDGKVGTIRPDGTFGDATSTQIKQ